MNAKLNQGNLYQVKDLQPIDYNDIPLKEYPHPIFQRESYICLNGAWDYEIKKESSLPNSYNKRIMVPYVVESLLSGVNHLLEPDEFIFYHKHISIPSEFNKGKVFLCFDGVDQIAEIFINNKFIYKHIGGYTPFKVDLTSYGNEFDLVVKVQDTTDTSYHSRGKQKLKTNGWFYSSSSGIYKTVYLESTPNEYIEEILITPNINQSTILVKVKTNGVSNVSFSFDGNTYELKSNTPTKIKVLNSHLWSLDDPYLYPVEVKLGEDKVLSYFGMRNVEIRYENNKSQVYLNNKKILLNGLLDQGYYFLGNLTPKSYDDYSFDVKLTKELGYNTLRKHIKIESDLFYYYCDKYGVLVIQDFPCGGQDYKFIPTVLPRVFDFYNKEKYISYKKLSRQDKEGREEFIHEGEEFLSMLHNHPSIIIYTIFNEGWGEFDPSKMYHHFKNIDSSRLYDTTSGWYEAKESDFHSIHAYIFTHRNRKNKKHPERPFILTEIGGASYDEPDHFYFGKVFGHHVFKDKDKLMNFYEHLYYKDIIPLMEQGNLVGAIYTQLADCEKECNGILTFDRKVLKIDKKRIIDINSKINDLMK